MDQADARGDGPRESAADYARTLEALAGDERRRNGNDRSRQSWDALADWSRSDRMNDLEAVMWRAERHPWLSSMIVALEILDREPDWQRLRSAHEWGSRMIPRFRQRVVDPALPIGPPAWEADDDFDLDYHLRREALPGRRRHRRADAARADARDAPARPRPAAVGEHARRPASRTAARPTS